MNLDVHPRTTAWGARVVTVTDPYGNRIEVSWHGRITDEFMRRALDEAHATRLRDAIEGTPT